MGKNIKVIETEYNGYLFRSRLEARWAVFFDSLGVNYEYEPEGFELPSGEKYLPDFRVKCHGKRGEYPDSGIFPCDKCKHNKGGIADISYVDVFLCDFYNPLSEINYNHRIPDWIKLRRPPERMEIVECSKMEHQEPFDLYIEVKGKMTQKDALRIREFSKFKPVLIVGDIPSHGNSNNSDAIHAYEEMNGIEIYPFNYETIDGDYFAAFPAAHDGKFYLWGDDSNYVNTKDIKSVERAYDKARQARFEHPLRRKQERKNQNESRI